MKRLILLLAIIVLVIGGMFYIDVFHNRKEDNKYQEISKEYNQKLKELRSEKEKLEKELEELEKNSDIESMASTILLISDTKKECLNDSIRLMDDIGYHGVIALDTDYLPDNEIDGYLNRNDINSLIKKGYEIVANIDSKDSPIDEYKVLNSLGYIVKGFYVENEITSNQISEIESIDNMVIIGNIENKDEYNSTIISNAGLCNTLVKNTFIDSVNNSSIFAISIGYKNKDNLFDEKIFNSMMGTIKPYVQDDQTKLVNITEAINRRNEYQTKINGKDKNIEQRKQEINNRINEIDDELIGK